MVVAVRQGPPPSGVIVTQLVTLTVAGLQGRCVVRQQVPGRRGGADKAHVAGDEDTILALLSVVDEQNLPL